MYQEPAPDIVVVEVVTVNKCSVTVRHPEWKSKTGNQTALGSSAMQGSVA